jgi:cyclic pyranopterin phosphate synthase
MIPGGPEFLADAFHRPLQDLRVSVTDRCNYRCTYCMPFAEYEWLEKSEVLSFEEMARLVRVFAGLGARKVRLTGGEPLVRRHLERLVAMLAAIPELDDLSLTTNGSSLAEKAAALKAAGLRRINVSLDTLRPERFRAITQRGEIDDVLRGLAAAKAAGLAPIKLNAVIERGVNDDEVADLADFARRQGFGLRFIEYMDAGNANAWSLERTVTKAEILERLEARFPLGRASKRQASDPATVWEFADGAGDVGVIASVTEPFCGSCTRARLTADGKLVTCLFSEQGVDLRGPLRQGATDDDLAEAIRGAWRGRRDRFSEERLEALRSGGGYRPGEHRKIEMIRLGG